MPRHHSKSFVPIHTLTPAEPTDPTASPDSADPEDIDVFQFLRRLSEVAVASPQFEHLFTGVRRGRRTKTRTLGHMRKRGSRKPSAV